MMIKLLSVTINKYKSILAPQKIDIDPKITTIVGMNESGKTSVLTAIAKTNYFNSDQEFKFDTTQDYPRNELVDFQNSGNEVEIITCEYAIQPELIKLINELGKDVFSSTTFTYTQKYGGGSSVGNIRANTKNYLKNLITNHVLSDVTKQAIGKLEKLEDVESIAAYEGDDDLLKIKEKIKGIISKGNKNWNDYLGSYIWNEYIKPRIPKFWYFDEYYSLSGKININELTSNSADERNKTAMALFELARIKPDEILNSDEYEKFVALLEASSNKITSEIFKYWSTNKNLDIEFRIQDIKNKHNQPEKNLDIRVKSQRHRISLPLDRRSKGFNWFFSFIVWFSKIQADKTSDYILLLDEPGLNLHASAQGDLLRFIEDLSDKYQIIYTTHSPFMVESSSLNRVRTCLETDNGTVISDSIQEKDPNTLFPLQAALGYDIAQNLFISKNNLLVEGPSDLIYLTVMSSILQSEKRVGLSEQYTIIPVGGLDKVTTFISLLRGSKLNLVCLLDTFKDQKGKQKVEDLIQQKIIKEKNIRFFDEFVTNLKIADIEDLFSKEEYVKLFNEAFSGEYSIKVGDLDMTVETTLRQVSKAIGKERFNHYRPANKLNQLGIDKTFFSEETLTRFENMFKEINKLI